MAILNDQSIVYSFTKTDIFAKQSKNSLFTFKDRYSLGIFQGIIPDSGAVEVLTAGEP